MNSTKKSFTGLFVLALSTLAFSASVNAASVTITSNAATEKEELQSLPQLIIGILADQGAKFRNVGTAGVVEIKLKNFHCDYRHRGALDASENLSGIPTSICRKNSTNVQNSTEGRLFRDGRALQDILSKIDNQPNSPVYFTDCGMGYCGTFAKSIVCQVDKRIENYSEGRFSCTLTDGN